jgi:hypothetical protein
VGWFEHCNASQNLVDSQVNVLQGFNKKIIFLSVCKALSFLYKSLRCLGSQEYEYIPVSTCEVLGTWGSYWLGHYSASRRVSGSIPSGVSGNFFRNHRRNHVSWGSTQPLKMSTRKTPGDNDGRCLRVTMLPPS